MLAVENVTIRYGAVVAVKDISFRAAKGEFISLLGPSGCGKTTLLRSIAGYVLPSEGKILLDGRDVTNLAPRDRRIGMVFQNYALFPHMTVAANVGFALRVTRWPKQKAAERVREMLDIVQLQSMADRYPSQLSGGQQQRVALARALAFDPQLLLLDEPLGALDLRLREAMQTEIMRLQRRTGVTAIFVTHDQGEALSMSDRVAVMNRGNIEQLAPPRELYNAPRTEFVADFVGRSNIFPLERKGNHWQIIGTGISLPAEPGRDDPRAALSIRPERIRLSHQPVDGALAGTVTAVIFNGLHQAVRVMTASVLEVVAHDHGDWQEGQSVQLSWKSDDARVVSADTPPEGRN
jgi:putative spermidine/putrescine transport system ATP-binding protein